MEKHTEINFSRFYLIEFFSNIAEQTGQKLKKEDAEKIFELLDHIKAQSDLVTGLEMLAREHGTSELTIFLFDIMDRISDYPPTLVYDSLPEMAEDFVNTLIIMLEEEQTMEAIDKVNGKFRELSPTEEKEIESALTEIDEYVLFEKIGDKLNEVVESDQMSRDLLEFSKIAYNSGRELKEDIPVTLFTIIDKLDSMRKIIESENELDSEAGKKIENAVADIAINLNEFGKAHSEQVTASLEKDQIMLAEVEQAEVAGEPSSIESLLAAYFQSEVDEQLRQVRDILSQLKQNIEDKESLKDLHSRLHSFKEISMIHGYEVFEHAFALLIYDFSKLNENRQTISRDTIKNLDNFFNQIEKSEKYRGKSKNSQESEKLENLLSKIKDSFVAVKEEAEPEISEISPQEPGSVPEISQEPDSVLQEIEEVESVASIHFDEKIKLYDILKEANDPLIVKIKAGLQSGEFSENSKKVVINDIDNLISGYDLLGLGAHSKFWSEFSEKVRQSSSAEQLMDQGTVLAEAETFFKFEMTEEDWMPLFIKADRQKEEIYSVDDSGKLLAALMEIERKNLSSFHEILSHIFTDKNVEIRESQYKHFNRLVNNLNLIDAQNLSQSWSFFVNLFEAENKTEFNAEILPEIYNTYKICIQTIEKKGKQANIEDIISTLEEVLDSEIEESEDTGEEPQAETDELLSEPEPEKTEEPIGGGEAEEDLELVFIQEAGSCLENSERAFSLISKNPADHESMHDIEKQIHSIKSSARLMGYDTFAGQLAVLEKFCEYYASSKKMLEIEKLPVLQDSLKEIRRLISEKSFSNENYGGNIDDFKASLEISEVLSSGGGDKDSLKKGLEEKPLFASSKDTDDEMLEIFKEESSEFVQQVDDAINKLKQKPDDVDSLHQLEYANHSLKSAAKMLGFSEIGQLSDGIERVAEYINKKEIVHTDEINDNLRAVIATVKLLTDGQIIPAADITDMIHLLDVQRIIIRQSEEGHISGEVSTDQEELDQMTEIFLKEGWELIEKINSDLVKLENKQDKKILDNLNRNFHTLKGSAQMFGKEKIGTIAHKTEDFLIYVLENQVTLPDHALDPVFAGIDEIQSALNSIKAGKGEICVSYQSVIESLERILSQVKSGSEISAPEAVTSDTTKPEEPVQSEEPEKPESEIKLSTNYLDKLINLAAELVVNKTQLNSHLSNLKNLGVVMDKNRETLNKAGYQLDDYFEKFGKKDPSLDEIKKLTGEYKKLSGTISDMSNEFSSLAHEFEKKISRISNLTKMLHDDILQVRMVPIENLFNRYPRVVRDISHKQNKKVKLNFEGQNTELDRAMIESVYDPLMHLLRNSIDHGIELPEVRKKSGKPEEGTITLKAKQDKNYVVIEVRDDGNGINYDAIRRKAVERKLATEEEIQKKREHELNSYLFQPGFSTKESVTEVSGRGVGLDVVADNIRKVKGDVRIISEAGKGTVFILRVPLTLVIAQAMMIELAGQVLAIPIASIEESVQISRNDITEQNGRNVLKLKEETLPIYFLEEVLKFETDPAGKYEGMLNAIVVEESGEKYIFVVDKILGREEIVIKPLGEELQNLDYISGGTILGDGSIGLIVDVAAVIRKVDAGEEKIIPAKTEKSSETAVKPAEEEPKKVEKESAPEKKTDKKPVALIVDDSISVRRFVGVVLQRHNFETVLASDGMEAIKRLEEGEFDIVVTDLEMPKMHGYELIQEIRKQEKYSNLPVVILTGRAGQKHRDMGLKLGANAFIVKPFKEADLVSTLQKFV